MKRFLFSLFFLPLFSYPFTIMLDPAGDAQHAGRIIDDSFERGVALQFAEGLRRAVIKEYPSVRVILARAPGEVTEELHQANFANRLPADLFISLHLYKEEAVKPRCALYFYVSNPVTDFWSRKQESISFTAIGNAHKDALSKTQLLVNNLFEALQEEGQKFELSKPVGLPFKPLRGLKMPAFALECGIKDRNGWRQYVMPLVEALGNMIL